MRVFNGNVGKINSYLYIELMFPVDHLFSKTVVSNLTYTINQTYEITCFYVSTKI